MSAPDDAPEPAPEIPLAQGAVTQVAQIGGEAFGTATGVHSSWIGVHARVQRDQQRNGAADEDLRYSRVRVALSTDGPSALAGWITPTRPTGSSATQAHVRRLPGAGSAWPGAPSWRKVLMCAIHPHEQEHRMEDQRDGARCTRCSGTVQVLRGPQRWAGVSSVVVCPASIRTARLSVADSGRAGHRVRIADSPRRRIPNLGHPSRSCRVLRTGWPATTW